jgi:Fe-S cluster assembly protein SufD
MDRGRASYLGAVNVAPGAFRTDAYQASRTLVLSPDARTDSSPQLQIQANDVRCSHGATVSNVDERMLFYLMSRGMSESRARSMIVSGFIAEIADKLPLETARDYVYNYVLERI